MPQNPPVEVQTVTGRPVHAESGRVILGLFRKAYRPGRPDEELRLTAEEFEGRPFVDVRIWSRERGAWWPTKRGCNLRVVELRDVAKVLREFADELDAGRGDEGEDRRARPART